MIVELTGKFGSNTLDGLTADCEVVAKALERSLPPVGQDSHKVKGFAVESPPIFDPEKGTLQLAGVTVLLEETEVKVLSLLVEKSPCTLKDLQKSGVGRPERILDKLCKKYPAVKPFITLPAREARVDIGRRSPWH